MLPLQGKVVSQTKGEMAGPCPFKNVGDDRFHWWAGSNNWWCRQECPDCPGKPAANGGMTGWFDDDSKPQTNAKPMPRPPRPAMDRVHEYIEGLDHKGQDYLASRGIKPNTTARFLIGQNCRRLTIPCIVGETCYGIKKRWMGKPPEKWISRYTMEPGSTGKAIFNYDRLVGRRRWSFLLIVEGILDVVLLDQLGIPAVAPFGGGGIWDQGWGTAFRGVDQIIVVADNDEEGLAAGQRKVDMLPDNTILVTPPVNKDIGESYLAGVDIHQWVREIVT